MFFSFPVNVSGQPASDIKLEKATLAAAAGKVEVMAAGSSNWTVARTNQDLGAGDRLRTGEHSRAEVQFTDLSVLRLNELTEIEIPEQINGRPVLKLNSGSSYFYSREKPGEVQIRTRLVSGAIRGTEFNLAVATNGRTELALLDGEVDLRNDHGQITLKSGESGTVEEGKAPVKTAMLDALSIIQWCLYYPGVLDADELQLTQKEQQELATSLQLYRDGDLLAALASYPEGRVPASDAEKIYHGALLLSVGQVEKAESDLKPLASKSPLAVALLNLVSVVKGKGGAPLATPKLATEWMVRSYRYQSIPDLKAALDAARQAISISPQFKFAWARVAELEFSFGHIPEAEAALDKALNTALTKLPPHNNAQALALQGFLLSAKGEWAGAMRWFDAAIASDGALANGWLGRGLVEIRQGKFDAGRKDLQMAAALEPNRAVLRSYLGKAFNQAGENKLAVKEFNLAKRLDPRDPTPFLYSALLNQQQNHINEAVRDLERSVELNDNRSVYRSQLLLDQDSAVRSANLASIYRDAGLVDVGTREATRAVQSDYANYSAHVFLGNTYNELRDPRQVDARYETPAFTEYLVGNLLAPVSGSTLSRYISQQEYSKFFERDRPNFSVATDYSSGGNWQQAASVYGNDGQIGYGVDSFYLTDKGIQPNNHLETLSQSVQTKIQLRPADSLYFQAITTETHSGDLNQYYNPASANTQLRTSEYQEPLLFIGYHHEWSPGVHTLFLGGRLTDAFRVNNPAQSSLLLGKDAAGNVTLISTPALPVAALDYHSSLEFYTAELQQIFQRENHTEIFGVRYQVGTFDTHDSLSPSSAVTLGTATGTLPFLFATPATQQSFSSNFDRFNAYAYENWRVFEPLLLTLGASYDYVRLPQDFRTPPVSGAEDTREKFSPKAGFIWDIDKRTTLRGSYTRSLGGVSFDQSVRLEPTQIDGFNQAYRSLIPESVTGSISAPDFETWDLLLDRKFSTGTYAGIETQLLRSQANRLLGDYDISTVAPFPITPSSTRQHLSYEEKNLIVTLNQLVGEYWSFGARYRLSSANLKTLFPDIPSAVSTSASANNNATLNELLFSARFNHRCGFFARGETLWLSQSNRGYTPALPGDDFWQFNAYLGYRFLHRTAEVELGFLNLGGQDYRLNPLNLQAELPRDRTFTVGFKYTF